MVRASLEIGNSNQELMEKPGRKRWRVWLTATVIFALILAMVITAVILLTKSKEADNIEPVPSANAITLDDIMKGKVSPSRFNATWISGDELLFTDDISGNLMIHNVRSDTKRELLSRDNQILATSFDHQLSADKKYLLLAFDYKKLYRHSYSAHYVAIHLETGEQLLIKPDVNESFIELAIWGPVGNAIAFVQHNNVYYRSSVTGPTAKISQNGIPGIIYNGVPDWVYEEEIFSSNKAIWFSRDGSHLAYGTFNDSLTQVMAISFYGRPDDPDSQYTRSLQVRYPKAGTTNPTAGVVLVKLQEQIESITLPVPDTLHEPILVAATFASNGTVAIVWTNRVQNESITVLCDTTCRQIFQYEETRGWVDLLNAPIFRHDGEAFFTILPKKIENDSWRQIAMVSQDAIGTPWTPKFITQVPNTVTEMVYWDEKAETMWFLATTVEDSAYQHLYSAALNSEINCFTCNITHSTGAQCLFNEAVFSLDGSHVIISCLGPQVPEVYIYTKNGVKVKNWETNRKLSQFLSTKEVPVARRYKVQMADKDLPPAHVTLLTPPNADLTGNVKYPMLVHVYGGPDSHQVSERWQMDWGMSLVSRWNITLAFIDGRGSGLKGLNNLFSIYRNLGTEEINDQINVTRHLQNSLGYIDPERTCIWGWSYGGFASAASLVRGGDTFRCAISVAPVTDWRLYDSIYTERYMGLPSEADNLKGYVASQLNNPETAAAIGKKKFMLIHGTLDDNVHFQQAMMLSTLLQHHDVLFTQMSYPDEDHSLNTVKPHLYHSIEQFLKANLLSKT